VTPRDPYDVLNPGFAKWLTSKTTVTSPASVRVWYKEGLDMLQAEIEPQGAFPNAILKK
jgi:hypothetical protein